MGVAEDEEPTTGVFRSETMSLCHLFLQPSIVFDVTCELGDLGIVEFRELNAGVNAFQRTYVDEVRRVEEIDRRLVYLNELLAKESDNIPVASPALDPIVPRYREILRLETNVEDLERNLRDVSQHLDSLRVKQMELNETNQVLLKTHRSLEFARSDTRTGSFLGEFLRTDEHGEQVVQFQRAHGDSSHKLHTITGVIRAEKANSFHTMIWRICGHNALVQFFDIETPIDDVKAEELVKKKVFLVMCQGDQLHKKLKKICEGFRATLYKVPSNSGDFREMSLYVDTNMKEIKIVIEQTLKQKYRMLTALAQAENMNTWKVQVAKLKAVFATMNLFRKTEKGFIAECWCANTDYTKLRAKIDQIVRKSGVQGQAAVEIIPTTMTRPTYYRLNKLTAGFQGIVDSYGIARYREMNPAPYTCISFPFLFAVMFADSGHGLIMLLFALWMVLFEKKLQGKNNNEIWLTFFDGRYIILLMSCFSIYTGFMYNDCFAKSINLFGTAFIIPHPKLVNFTGTMVYRFPEPESYVDKEASQVYPYGLDPMWQLAGNKILFINSYKMKLSVILGVLQMLFGVILSLFNHYNFKNYLSMICEFVPQIIFLLCLFGYMNTLIFAKWLTVWDPPANAPSILIDFINMFLMKYPEDGPLYLRPWFENKALIQKVLLGMALLSVPVMLLVKPTILVFFSGKSKKAHHDIESNHANNVNNHSNHSKAVDTSIEASLGEPQGGAGDHEDEGAGDIYIHQAIHTIEYCLGSISHTASYLRLWALSLAHSQLSEVLWTMVLRSGLSMNMSGPAGKYINAIFCYLAFGFWAVLTVAILILMEGLSAFLHAIRLHWVEFQSKFYIGDGYNFQPFSFKALLAEKPV